MTTLRVRKLPGNRLARGAAILKAAQEVDTSLVKERLTAFTKAHTRYGAAQQDVDAAEARLRQKQARVMQRDAEQDHAVEQLARELIHKGQARSNPFAVFGAPAPSAIKLLPYAEEATAIHDLVAALRRSATLPKTTLKAAQAAENAARAVEVAQAPTRRAATDSRRSAPNPRHHRANLGCHPGLLETRRPCRLRYRCTGSLHGAVRTPDPNHQKSAGGSHHTAGSHHTGGSAGGQHSLTCRKAC